MTWCAARGSASPESPGTHAFPWRFWIDGDPTVSPFRWGRGAAEAAALDGTPPVLN